ncbi:MAG: hypothetical protein ABR567_08170 [Myxococcales bacterium]|nr:hypothetical protein [Myxococcales bacterium]
MKRAFAVVLVFSASCSRCGGPQSAASAEELLPANPSGAIVTAPLGALAQHAAALVDRVARLPGGEQLTQMRAQLAAQLGFDPLTREGLLSAGLDPDRGAAVALFEARPRPEWVVALPLTKPDVFAQTVQRLMVERFGASPGAQPQTFERAGSTIAWKVVKGYGMMARGASPMARLQPPAENLTKSSGLAHAREKLGAQDVIVWAPAGSDLPRRYTPRKLPGDVALSLQGAPQGLAVRLFADAVRGQHVLPGGGASLVELLPGDAPLRMRLGIAPQKLIELIPDDRIRGLIPKDAFDGVKPGFAISIALAQNARLAQALDYGLDWRRKSPFDTIQLVALAEVADEKKVLASMEQIARSLPRIGARAERKGNEFATFYPAGKGPRFGVRGGLAYVFGGEVGDLHKTPKAANPEAAALYEDQGLALRADFGKLAAAVHALPEATYGTGPQSYVTRSVVAQVIDPLTPLRVTLDAQAQPDFFGASLDVEIAGP